MRRLLTSAALLLAVVLLATPGASAFPPKTVPSGIDFNQNIGAMKLGMTKSQALKAWGNLPDCGARGCVWSDANRFFGTRAEGIAAITFSGGRVRSISIRAVNGSKGSFLRSFRFDPQVGLYSTRAEVRNSFRQFPPADQVPAGKVRTGKVDRVITLDGKRETAFFYNTKGRLIEIKMRRL